MKKSVIAASALVVCGAVVCLAWQPGRMTGGGSVFLGDLRVTHGFELHCGSDASPAPPPPNNLEINWGGGHNFHTTLVTSADCIFDPAVGPPNPPDAPFNTYIGHAVGLLDGVAGATIDFTFTDAGEPGTRDTASYLIRNSGGTIVLSVPPTVLTFGNHQAHRCTGSVCD